MLQAQKKILCIEDNREAASLIVEELVERGYVVTAAHNGRDGFAAILKEPPDLVLCDITMPVMTGFEVLERLTELAPRFAHIPFVFITALSDRQNELKGRKLGADDYVTKPIDFDILETIIKARLVNVARAQVWADTLKTQLSDREVEMLAWAARGKTSADISEILGLSKRTVDFHMNNAREKLGVATRTQAVIKAAAGNIIDPWEEVS